MSYNHPYFNHPYYKFIVEPRIMAYRQQEAENNPAPNALMPMPSEIIPAHEVDECRVRDDSIFGFRPNYRPDVLLTGHMIWEDPNSFFMDAVSKEFNPYNTVDGYTVDVDSRICKQMGAAPNVGGMIAATIMQPETSNILNDLKFNCAPVIIVNTENAGLRYVRKDPNSSMMYDIGPVTDMCIVGNKERPEGVYVPFNNARAMADAIAVLDNELASFEGIATVTEVIANEFKRLPSSTEEKHECTCGGNCKCNCHNDFDL